MGWKTANCFLICWKVKHIKSPQANINDLQFADNYMMVTLTKEAMQADVNHIENTQLKERLFYTSPDRVDNPNNDIRIDMKTWSVPQNSRTWAASWQLMMGLIR